MAETARQKASRVAHDLLTPLSFDGIRFKETRNRKVKFNGGVETKGKVISFDSRYVLKAPETVLAFVLAHEHHHAKLQPSVDEYLWRMQQMADAVVRVGAVEPREVSLKAERLEDAVALLLKKEEEWDADDHAINALYDCDRSVSQARATVTEYRLQEWYFKEIYSKPEEVLNGVRDMHKRLMRRCGEIWAERQKC